MVSNKGRVKSIPRDVGHGSLGVIKIAGKILKPFLRPYKGTYYPAVSLCYDGGREARYIHYLVAQVFLPAPKERGLVVVHLNGDVNNNTVENLEWQDTSNTMIDVPSGPVAQRFIPYRRPGRTGVPYKSANREAKREVKSTRKRSLVCLSHNNKIFQSQAAAAHWAGISTGQLSRLVSHAKKDPFFDNKGNKWQALGDTPEENVVDTSTKKPMGQAKADQELLQFIVEELVASMVAEGKSPLFIKKSLKNRKLWDYYVEVRLREMGGTEK